MHIDVPTRLPFWLASTCLLLCAASATATVTVPGDYATIQAALDDVAPGEEILVAPGAYLENLTFGGKDVFLRSTSGADATFLIGAGGTVVDIGPAGEISGFTISGGSATFGAGMRVHGASTLIARNRFDGNQQGAGGYGAGIGGNSASPIVDANVFVDNSCDSQFLSGVVCFVNGSSPTVTNNVFLDNPCRAVNLTLPAGTTPRVVNNTMVGNAVGIRVEARVPTNLQVYRNNVVVDNGIGLEVDFGSPPNNPTWTHNLVFDNVTNYDGIADQTGSNGNLSVDPLFDDAELRLAEGSPAIDVGTASDAPDHDRDGNLRPMDGDGDGTPDFDMGAYEREAAPAALAIAAAPPGFAAHARPSLFTASTSIHFQVHVDAPVTVRIFDTRGRLVRTLLDEHVTAGNHRSDWDGRDRSGRRVARGVYFYEVASFGVTATGKLTAR